MPNVDENLERLIVRSLDGALSEDEQLVLDRELIRNPEAHRLLKEYRSIDGMASASLEAMVCNDEFVVDLPEKVARQPARARGFNRGWLLIPGAIAATLLAVAIPRPASDSIDRGAVVGQRTPTIVPSVRSPSYPMDHLGVMRSVGTNPSVRRRTGRDLIGVVGDDGNLYWIEVERTRTVSFPQQRPTGSGSFEEL